MVQPANKRLVTEAALAAHDYVTAAEVQTIEGPQGPQGEVGPAGPQGEVGPQGPAGADGAPGAAATIVGADAVTTNPGTLAGVENIGTSSAANFRFYIPRGDVGEQGSQGVKGDTGDTGPAGTNGTNGTDGTSADITSVTATGLPAGSAPTATLGGTALARTIEFGIPAGETGPAGSGGDGGLAMPRVLVSGRWVNTTITGTSMTTVAAVANRMYLVAFVPHRDRTINALGCNVSTAATGNIRLGLYNSDPESGIPTTVLFDPGSTISSGTTGGKTVTASVTMTSGVQYWTALTCTGTATFTAGGSNEMWPIAGGASQSNVGSNFGYMTHSADSALPDLTSASLTWSGGSVPMCTMRIA